MSWKRRCVTATADSDGGGQQRWGQRSTVAGDDDISYWCGGGSNVNIILLSIVHSLQEFSRKSPGSLQEVLSQLLPDS